MSNFFPEPPTINVNKLKSLHKPRFVLIAFIFFVAIFTANSAKASNTKTLVLDSVDVNMSTSLDSDTIKIKNAEISASGTYDKKLNWGFGVNTFEISAGQSSGLRTGNINSDTVDYYQPWFGLRSPFYKTLNADIKLGYETTSEGSKTTSWEVAFDGYFFNSLYGRIFIDHMLYAVSPLAISRDIDADLYGLEANWSPAGRFHLSGGINYMNLSDHNTRWHGMLAPAWSVSKTDVFDFTLGLKGLYFRFDKDLGNGYYDPQEAQKYLLTYDIGIHEPGIGDWRFSGAAGRRKDERIGEFDYALEFSADGNFTLHPGIDLGLRASALREGGGDFQPYWWHEFGLNVTARF